MEDYKDIISKAKELSYLIENHEITKKYRETITKMSNDIAAQKLLADLVMLGRDINEQLLKGELQTKQAELEILKKEFEQNEIVKEHLLCQKEYLLLIKSVQDRIKNPIEED